MIQDTCVEIDGLRERSRVEREQRYARRNRIRYIDALLNELEMLNIAEENGMSVELAVRIHQLLAETSHPLAAKPVEALGIAESMEALYEMQDGLMITLEGVDDEEP
jgi:hypothetical protein